MQNPKPVAKSTENAAAGVKGPANDIPIEPFESTNESPKLHIHDVETGAPPVADRDDGDDGHLQDAEDIAHQPPSDDQMLAPPPPAAPHQFQQPPPPVPPFLQPMIMQQPPPYYQLPPYLNHHVPFPPYGYPMIFQSAPSGNVDSGNRLWSTGLFDCFSDLKNCFITTFCPCVTFGQVSEIINEGHTAWWEGAVAYFLVEIATLSLGSFVCAWTYRTKMRRKHSLQGHPLRDLCETLFFTRFSLCQLYRQLDQLGYNVPLGWIANKDNKQGNRDIGDKLQVVPPAVESGMFR